MPSPQSRAHELDPLTEAPELRLVGNSVYSVHERMPVAHLIMVPPKGRKVRGWYAIDHRTQLRTAEHPSKVSAMLAYYFQEMLEPLF